jgi:hypothetical protein
MLAICEEMARRRLSQDPVIQRMTEVRDRYNGDVVVPVPEVDDDLPLATLAPLLIAEAIEHPALYAAQMPPNITVPALTPGKMTGVRSTDYASRRRKALSYSWDKSWWDLLVGRVYRHLAGYATSAIVVELDMDRHLPIITARDPLMSYPEPKSPEDMSLPINVGFVQAHSRDWLHARYPETVDRYPPGPAFPTSGTGEGELWDIVEWMDADEIVMGVLGPRDAYNSWTSEPIRWAMELHRFPNVMGRCPAIIPRRVTLDRIIAQLSNLTGHVDLMAKLMYLDIRATEQAVFPSRYILAKQGQHPRLVDGVWHEGESGETNVIIDADAVGELRGTPDPNNKATIDRVERNMRVSTGLVPQAGGETYGALRTGRGIDSLLGAALDPRTAELHHVAERYFTEANELVLLGYRHMWPRRSYSVSSPLDPGAVEFTPSTHIETDHAGELFLENRVHYPIPGMDDINATQVIGQMVGANLVSLYDARRMHPHVRDPEGTERQLLVETLENLALGALGQRATTGGIPPTDLAEIIRLVREGHPIHKAIEIADEAASARQAAEPPAPPPGMMAAPEAMPGLAVPGEGAEAGMGGPPISGPPEGLENLRSLAQALQAPA